MSFLSLVRPSRPHSPSRSDLRRRGNNKNNNAELDRDVESSLHRSSEADDGSSEGDKAFNVIAQLRAATRELRAEILGLKRRQAALVRDMIIRDGYY